MRSSVISEMGSMNLGNVISFSNVSKCIRLSKLIMNNNLFSLLQYGNISPLIICINVYYKFFVVH